MKKILTYSVLALAAASSLNAKTAEELRIYINPGHGSWTGNDRPAQIVSSPSAYSRTNTDTLTFFYESNTNLRKGFGVLEKLIELGIPFDRTKNQTGDRWQIGAARDLEQNIVMSHVKCGPYLDDNATSGQYDSMLAPYKTKLEAGETLTAAEQAEYDNILYLRNVVAVRYNRNLSEICAEVNANNFDMFISIHSNAATEGSTTNYPVYLYRGYDTPAESDAVNYQQQVTSQKMAKISWPYAYANPFMVWTATSTYNMTKSNVRGDCNFYRSSVSDANKALIDAKKYAGYLGALKHNTPGFLVEGYFHTYQPARHRAMNWDVDYIEGYCYARGIAEYFGLGKEKTGDIYGIVRDLHEKFTHNLYKPNPNSDDIYLPLNGVTVKLMKGEDVVETYTTDNNYNGVFAFRNIEPGTYSVVVEAEGYKDVDPVEVTVKAAETAYPATISLEAEGYEPPKIKAYTYMDEFNMPAYGPQSKYNFSKVYEAAGAEALEGVTVKRSFVRKNNIYVMGFKDVEGTQTPVVMILDAATGALVRELGTIADLSDIAMTADNYLVGINTGTQPYGGTAMIKFLKWENSDEDKLPAGDPVVMFTDNRAGNWTNGVFGKTMTYGGTLDEGTFYFSAVTTATNKGLRIQNAKVLDGVLANSYHMNQNTSKYAKNENETGNYQLHVSPTLDKNYIIVSEKLNPVEFITADGAAGIPEVNQIMAEELKPASMNVQIFKYAGATYMTVPAVDGENHVGVTILDITEGLDKAKAVRTVSTELPAAEIANTQAMGQTVVARDASTDEVTSGWMNLFALRADGVAHFTTKSVEQPLSLTSMAYDLKSEAGANDNECVLTFKLSEPVVDATAILTPVDGEGDVVRIALGALEAGENTLTIDDTEIAPNVSYNWAIEAVSESNGFSGQARVEKNSLGVRGGVIPMTDPMNPAFGKVVVGHGKRNGFDFYDAAGNKIADKLHKNSTVISTAGTNQSDPFRGSEFNGYGIFPTWGDKGAGVLAVNVMEPDAEPFSLFRNGTNDGSGNYVIDGKNCGGGSAGAGIYGSADNAKLVSFSEDVEGKNGSGSTENSLWVYEVGGCPWAVTGPGTQLPTNGYKSKLANGQADILPFRNGFFATHYRSPGNNVSGCPGFIYVDGDTYEIKFNSGDREELPSVKDGVAITPDGKTLAVLLESGIAVFDVEWDEKDVPTISYLYTFGGANARYTHPRFDYAGNLHVYRPSDGYYVYALKRTNPTVTTPATADYIVKVNPSGVEEISVGNEDIDAPVEYFNLNGIRVASDNLTPGIYIKRQGKKVEKVLVK